MNVDRVVDAGAAGVLASSIGDVLSSLVCYEFVLTGSDFFISVNGLLMPSECSGFSVEDDWCFRFHHEEGDLVSWPVPVEFRELVLASEGILFVRFGGGAVVDACVLTNKGMGHVSGR